MLCATSRSSPSYGIGSGSSSGTPSAISGSSRTPLVFERLSTPAAAPLPTAASPPPAAPAKPQRPRLLYVMLIAAMAVAALAMFLYLRPSTSALPDVPRTPQAQTAAPSAVVGFQTPPPLVATFTSPPPTLAPPLATSRP